MNNQQFLKDFIKIVQISGFFDIEKELGYATAVFSTKSLSDYSNFSFVWEKPTAEQLTELEIIAKNYDRKPVVMFENTENTVAWGRFIEGQGYQKVYEDQWLFHSGENLDESKFNQVKIVNDEKSLKTAIEIFNASYQEGDSQNPYGSVADYLEQAEESWRLYSPTGEVAYYLAYKDEEPVAIAMLTNYNTIGYISGVGSLKKVRGEGFGKLVTSFAVSQSKSKGNVYHCLATEKGTNPHEFYIHMGFVNKFSTIAYKKK